MRNSCRLKLFGLDGSSDSGLAILFVACIICTEINGILFFCVFYHSCLKTACKD